MSAMDWDKLRIFHVVAQAGSFTRAGERLNISQSAVSRQVGTLEENLGAQLFTRHARGLILTAEGELLHKTVMSVFAQISATQNRLLESRNEAKGELRVACSVAFGSIWMPPRLHLFSEMYPGINLCLALTDTEVDFSMREADIAISYGPPKHPNMTSSFFVRDTLQMYASKEYLLDYGTPKYPEDLDYHKLIVFGTHITPPFEGVNWTLKVGAETGHVRDFHVAVNNAYAIMQLIEKGTGIGALPHFVARDFNQLIPVLPECKGPSFDLHITHPDHLNDSKKVKAFKEFLENQIKL